MKKTTCLLLFFLFYVCLVYAQSNTTYPQGLKVGDRAPDFTAADQHGNAINLKKALLKGPVVLLFYRGEWCPYCTRQMNGFSDSLALLTAKGATVMAVSPETAERVKKTIEKTKTVFTVLEDTGMAIMKKYRVNFAVDEKTVTQYKGYGIDFDKANGTNGANLPVPATYIIGKDGTVKYVFFNTDYRKRASVTDIVNNL